MGRLISCSSIVSKQAIILFIFSLNFVLISSAEYGESCGVPGDCAPDLDCISSFCKCKGEDTSVSFFDVESRTCFTLAEKPCDSTYNCIPTATCYNSSGNPTCNCNYPLSKSDLNKCYLNYSQPCRNKNDLCNPERFLSCDHQGFCNCSQSAIYDIVKEECLLLPGAQCDLLPDSQECVGSTTCSKEEPTEPYETCKCLVPKSIPSVEKPGECYLPYNEPCVIGIDTCNPFEFLKCQIGDIEERCFCEGEKDDPPSSIFDTESNTCLKLAGESCNNDGMNCVPHATCVTLHGVSKCTCNGSLFPNSDKFCYLEYGEPCSTANDLCDPNKFLSCNLEGTCDCSHSAIYDNLKNKCAILPGKQCTTSVGGQECVDGTKCLREKTGYTCKCPLNSDPSIQEPWKCYLSHHQVCDPAIDLCDPNTYLKCQRIPGDDNRCVCNGENITSTFDSKSKTCLQLAGETCQVENMNCVPHATCVTLNGDSKCICNGELSTNSEKFCYLSYGDKCSGENDLCDPNKFLSCDLEGQCSCSSSAVYNTSLSTCLLYPGSNCTTAPSSQLCVSDIKCSKDSEGSTCECPSKAVQSLIDPTKCFLNHNEICQRENDICDRYAHLQCAPTTDDNRCLCANPDNTWYDIKSSTCYLKVDEPCYTSNHSQKCTPNSKCLQENRYQKCICDKDFTKNRYGRCYFPYNSSCSLDNDLCDPGAFLSCDQSNQCKCSKDAWYEETVNMCGLLSNATCTQSDTFLPWIQPCVPNAICSPDNVCKCLDDLIGNVDRKCYLEHGATCDPVRDLCDGKEFLYCSRNSRTCLCEGEEDQTGWYNEYSKTCFLLEGTPCNPQNDQNNGDWNKCVLNSYCDPLDEVCTCNGTLKANPQHFCYLPYDVDCNVDNDLCDPEGFLECNKYTGKCACARQYETYYDEENSFCRLIHDRPCTLTFGSQLCDPNAECSTAGGNSTLRCRCEKDYQPNVEGICYLLYDQPCTLEDFCDPNGHLICRDDAGKCGCQTDEMYFDLNEQQCFTFPGGSCSVASGNQKCRENSICNPSTGKCECLKDYDDTEDGECLRKYGASCNENDPCHHNINLECQQGICLCPKGYLEHNLNGSGDISRVSCLPGFNITCGSNLECNPEAYLKCQNDTCVCNSPKEQLFIGNLRQCRSLYKTPCNDETLLCVPNAYCDYGGNTGAYGICKCDANSTESAFYNGLCVKSSAPLSSISSSIFSFLCLFWFLQKVL